MLPEERILELAEAVADGVTPDWDSVRSNATDDSDRERIEQLRAVSVVAGWFTKLTLGHSLAHCRHELLSPGTRWGNLRILEHVGHGRFGHVYRAWDDMLDREVALKLLSRGDDADDPGEVIREGRLMARVRHPNVLAIHGAERIAAVTGLWMEFVEGRTLAAELAERGPFGADALASVATQLCSALHAVHSAGLVHRDVKAQNVLRDQTGRIVLGDFGTGRDVADAATSGGALAGTPMYIAPEIFAGAAATPQSDLYSLGVLLFHLATGTFPVVGGSLRALKSAHGRGQRRTLRDLRPDLPDALVRAVDTALAPASRRFQTALAMHDAVDRWCVQGRSQPVRSRRRRTAAAAVVAGVSLAALTSVAFRPEHAIPFSGGDFLVVTAFENATADPDLEVIGDAFQLALLNSTRVNVMQPAAVSDLLRQVRESGDRVDLQAVQAMAVRAPSIRVLLTGDVKEDGAGYAITARLIGTDATVLAAYEASGLRADSIMQAVDGLSRQMRRRFGESVDLPANDRSVSTRSVAALKLYVEAMRLMRNGPLGDPQREMARGLLERALVNDPAFALARVALAWTHTSREAAVTQFARAIADAERREVVERWFVAANAWRGTSIALREPLEQVRAHERAVAACEALVGLQPNNVAALELLALLYQRSGRRAGGASLRARVAELVPFSVVPQLAVARDHVERGDYEGAGRYIARVRELSPRAGDLPPSQRAWLSMLDAQFAWIANDLHSAAAAADRVRGTLADVEGEARQQLVFHLLSFYLTLGRLRDAGAIVQSAPRDQEWLRALVLAVSDDRARLRGWLQSRFQAPELAERVGSLWVDAGLLTKARAVITRTPSLIYEGQLALADGNHPEAIRLLTLAMSQAGGYGDTGEFRAARTLAEAVVQVGDIDRAIAILERQSTRRHDTLSGASSGYEWLRVRAQLAKVYRRAGRVADAEMVEGELETLLTLADQDHPLKRALRARPLTP